MGIQFVAFGFCVCIEWKFFNISKFLNIAISAYE